MRKLYGAVEGGGTKFVCAVGTGPDDLIVTTIPTTTPAETLPRVIEFFRRQPPLQAIGIASFGPLDYAAGGIGATPNPGWSNTPLVEPLRAAVGSVPALLETDVNGAALGEHRWGAAQGLNDFLYVTVGTGLGGGGLVNGKLLRGLLHPEMGHQRVPHDWQADPFPGSCPFHVDCLEGLASGRAIALRCGQPGQSLPSQHPLWPLVARYVVLGLVNCVLTLSPQRVVLGGGVTQQAGLLPLIRQQVKSILNGYLAVPEILTDIERYIVPSALGQRAGLLGAIALAQGQGV